MNKEAAEAVRTQKMLGQSDDQIRSFLKDTYSEEDITNALGLLEETQPSTASYHQDISQNTAVQENKPTPSVKSLILFAIAFLIAERIITYIVVGIIQFSGLEFLHGGDSGWVHTVNEWGILVARVIGLGIAVAIFYKKLHPVFLVTYLSLVALNLLTVISYYSGLNLPLLNVL